MWGQPPLRLPPRLPLRLRSGLRLTGASAKQGRLSAVQAERSSAEIHPQKSPGSRRGFGPLEILCDPCVALFDVLLGFQRLDHHELAHGTLVHELDTAADLGKKRVVLAATDVEPRLHPRAALPHNDRAARDDLSAKSLKTQPLRIRITTVS